MAVAVDFDDHVVPDELVVFFVQSFSVSSFEMEVLRCFFFVYVSQEGKMKYDYLHVGLGSDDPDFVHQNGTESQETCC